MGEQPPGSLANAAEIDQPLLVAIVLQCRGVLGRKDRRFQPAAVKTAASWCRSRICSIVILSFESSRTFRSTAPGEITGSDAPGACSHARPISTTPVAQAAIGMDTAPGSGPHHPAGAASHQARFPARGRTPAHNQRLDPYRLRCHHAARRRRPRGPRDATLPARGTVAGRSWPTWL